MLWKLSDFLPHLAAPVRALDVELDGFDAAVPTVRLSLRPPTPIGEQVPIPRAPGQVVALVLPAPEEMDLPSLPTEIQDGYRAAYQWSKDYQLAELRVVCAPSVGTAVAIDSLIMRYRLAAGVLTEEDTCVVALPESYRGPGAGRVITLREAPGGEAGPRWLYPSALYAYVSASALREHERGGMFIAGRHEVPYPPAALLVEFEGSAHRVEVLDVRIDRWPERAVSTP